MISQITTLSHFGATPHRILIEIDVYAGLPGITIVGLPSKAIEESRERIRSAIRNSGLEFPPRKITVNLAPADIAKTGTNFDLAIAVGILAATEQIPQQDNSFCFVAELALDGSFRPAQDSLASLLSAEQAGFTTIVIDPETEVDIDLGKDLQILQPQNLRALYLHLIGEEPIQPRVYAAKSDKKAVSRPDSEVDFNQIRGQAVAKRALQIAAAGRHNLLLIGPPGVGKSLLAHSLPGILPPATTEEIREICYIHSLAGLEPPQPLRSRPFRMPHHSTSQHALVGGGSRPRPGEISLAHNGVLFLDELPEFTRQSLEALRQPIEDGQVTIARTILTATFPARAQVIAAMNPCPCGYYGSTNKNCSCSLSQISHYQKRISGPLLDRFDMIIHLDSEAYDVHNTSNTTNSTDTAVDAVGSAYRSQAIRFSKLPGHRILANADIPYDQLTDLLNTNQAALDFLQTAADKLQLSPRSIQRSQRVARTIADLDNNAAVECGHFAEAIAYKRLLTAIA